MLNKIKFYIVLFTTVGCTYNPDAGKYVKFTPLSSSNSNTIVIDKINFFRAGYIRFLPTVTQFNIFNSTKVS